MERVIEPASAANPITVVRTDAALRGLSAENFCVGHRTAPLAIAYVSPHVDFSKVTAALSSLAGGTTVVAVSTAGELCSCGPDDDLYHPAVGRWDDVVVQIFPADLLADVCICSVPLPNDDIRRGAPTFDHEARIVHMIDALLGALPPFRIDVRDTVALTFIDGLSASENYFLEAAYRSGRFPCLFIGGSAGGLLDFKHTSIFDSREVLENHAVCVFLKLREGRGYGVLKSQNFAPTSTSFVVIEADPDRRIVNSVIDPQTGQVASFLDVLARLTGAEPQDVVDRLQKNTFGIEINGEFFIRSIVAIDPSSSGVAFYCDVNAGDTLVLLSATDFVAQTRDDVADYLKDNPPALGAVLNDCILRRLHNADRLPELSGVWPFPVAGFSTFGELFGINVNETLSALIFFDTAERPVHDRIISDFATHYADFRNYFTSVQLNRLQTLNRLRQQAMARLAKHIEVCSSWGHKVEDAQRQMGKIRQALAAIEDALPKSSAGALAELNRHTQSLYAVLQSIDTAAMKQNEALCVAADEMNILDRLNRADD
jgi:hypothetical protein